MSDHLTPGERDVWRSVYATSWHASSGNYSLGHVHDADRALWCALQADRALLALRELAAPTPPDSFMVQVLS